MDRSLVATALRARVPAVLGVGLTIGGGLAVRSLLEGPVANFGGTALWAGLVVCLVLLVVPRLPGRRLFVWSLAICLATEGFQLTGVPLTLYQAHPAFALVFGTTFQWADVAAYVLGTGVGGVVQGRYR